MHTPAHYWKVLHSDLILVNYVDIVFVDILKFVNHVDHNHNADNINSNCKDSDALFV